MVEKLAEDVLGLHSVYSMKPRLREIPRNGRYRDPGDAVIGKVSQGP